MTKGLYAIRDTLSKQLLGGVHLFAGHPPAVRFFGDVASDTQTMIARHPQDHELIMLGTLDEETATLIGLDRPEIIITGTAWKAAQQQPSTEAPQ